MTGETILFLLAGALAGGIVNGMSGTGMALFSLGFYLVVLDPLRAVAIVALMSIMVGMQGLWVVRAAIVAEPKRALRFVLPGLIGVPIGVPLLTIVDAGTLRMAVAGFLIIYGGYFGFRATLPAFERPTPKADMLVGLTGGVLGGATSISGAVPQMWLSLRPWTKAETRAVLQPFNMAVLSTTVCLLFFKGAYDRTTLSALIVTIPSALIGAQIGIAIFARLSDLAFRRLLIVLTLMMGLGIMASEVF